MQGEPRLVTLCILMGLIQYAWAGSLYIEIHVKNSKLSCTSVLEIYFISANSADPDEMPHTVAFHLNFHCLP